MQQILDEVFKLELIKNKNNIYTLGRDTLDKFWGLNYFSVEYKHCKEDVDFFASISYILGVLGFYVQDYATVPAGFVTTYKLSKKDYVTLVITSELDKFYRERIYDLITVIIKNNKKLNAKEISIIKQLNKEIKTKKSLLEICCDINILIQKNIESCNNLSLNLSMALVKLNNAITDSNFTNNELLKKACYQLYGINAKTASADKIKEAERLISAVQTDGILAGYFEYLKNVKKYKKKFSFKYVSATEHAETYALIKSKKRCAEIMNRATTNKASEIVYLVLHELAICLDKERTLNEINRISPPTDNGEHQIKLARKFINDLFHYVAIREEDLGLTIKSPHED